MRLKRLMAFICLLHRYSEVSAKDQSLLGTIHSSLSSLLLKSIGKRFHFDQYSDEVFYLNT